MQTKRHFPSLFFFILAVLFGPATAMAEPSGDGRIEVAGVGFATPESVEYNAAEDVYLVTNINGDPLTADDNGFISKIKPDGSVIELKWIDGADPDVVLNAPKGAAIVGDHLFVTDINQVHIFSLPEGRPEKSVTVRGSTFLNGIATGKGDYVYVTDSGLTKEMAASGTDAIYKVRADGRYEAIVKDEKMGHPNGIWDDGDRLLVVTFGSGQVISIDGKGRQTPLPAPPQGGLDGLVKLQDGRFLMSSWDGAAIYALNPDKTYSLLAGDLDAPADLGVDTRRSRLLIPLFKQNKVVALPF